MRTKDDATVFPSATRNLFSRRHFLTFSGAWFGLLLGTSCVGGPPGASEPPPPSPPAPSTPSPTGDLEHDELRRLAVVAPLPELLQMRLHFLMLLGNDYRHDPVLWRGVERLCDAVAAGEAIPDRRLFARLLAQVIERGEPELAVALLPRVPELRRVP